MFDLAVIGLGAAGLEVLNIALDKGLKVIAFDEKEIPASLGAQTDFKDSLFFVKSTAELLLNDDKIEVLADDNIHQAKNIIIATGSNENDNEVKTAMLPKIIAMGCKDECRLNIYSDFTTDFDNLYVIGSAAGSEVLTDDKSMQAQKVMEKILTN